MLGADEEAVPTVWVRADEGLADRLVPGWEKMVTQRHLGAEHFYTSDLSISRSGAPVRTLSSYFPHCLRETPRAPECQNWSDPESALNFIVHG